jgi:hypothetical protein
MPLSLGKLHIALETLKEMVPGLKVCLKETILEAAEQFTQNNGHVTSSRLEEMFDSFESKIFEGLQGLHARAGDLQANCVPPMPPTFGFQNLLYGTYEYNNKTDMQVPQVFTFPASTQHRTGWDLLLKGDPDSGAAHGRGASSRDPRYLEQLWRVVDGEVEEGPCGIKGCTFPDLALHHKCTTCGKYVHNPCAIQNGLFDKGNSTQSQPVRRYCRLACKPSTY